MTGPPLNAFAQSSYDWLEPIQADDDQHGFVLAAICGGVGIMFDEVEQLVRARPGRDPWQQAFDIDACPDFQVPWLGQCVGVRVTLNVPAWTQRLQVKAEAGFWRGGVASLVSAIKLTLTGTQKVLLTERAGGDAWAMTVLTDPLETPNPTLTNQVAQAAKVAALGLTVSARSVPVINDGARVINAGTGTIDAATFPAVN